MAIDSSIYSQIQQPRPVNLLAQYADMMQVQGAQQANQLNRLKMDEYTRGVERQNKLTGMLQTGADAAALRQGGFLKEANEWDEQAAKIEKERAQGKKYGADAEKAQLETAMSKVRFGAQLLSTAKDQATYDAARQEAIANGLDVSRMPAQFDPAFVQRKFQESQTVAEQLDQLWKQKGYDLDVQKVAETGRHNRASEGIQVRGQNMADARAREANGNAKAPAGYRWSADGQSLEPIPGGPAVKSENASEGERKAATLLKRLEGSQAQLNAALTTNPDAAKPGLIASGLRTVGAEAAANSITGTQRQQVEAAQLDILDAALTLGTGAAYTREQLEGYRKSYFPQIGDDPPTVADKAARLNNVIESAKIAAGRAAKAGVGPAPQQPAQPGARAVPAAGTVQDGYRFKGGNPADPKSWEKV